MIGEELEKQPITRSSEADHSPGEAGGPFSPR
jgi:hypothetical protein